jgi:hypothetical protein
MYLNFAGTACRRNTGTRTPGAPAAVAIAETNLRPIAARLHLAAPWFAQRIRDTGIWTASSFRAFISFGRYTQGHVSTCTIHTVLTITTRNVRTWTTHLAELCLVQQNHPLGELRSIDIVSRVERRLPCDKIFSDAVGLFDLLVQLGQSKVHIRRIPVWNVFNIIDSANIYIREYMHIVIASSYPRRKLIISILVKTDILISKKRHQVHFQRFSPIDHLVRTKALFKLLACYSRIYHRLARGMARKLLHVGEELALFRNVAREYGISTQIIWDWNTQLHRHMKPTSCFPPC